MIQVHKKLIWFNDWTCALQDKAYLYCKKEKKKKKLERFHTPNVSMADAM